MRRTVRESDPTILPLTNNNNNNNGLETIRSSSERNASSSSSSRSNNRPLRIKWWSSLQLIVLVLLYSWALLFGISRRGWHQQQQQVIVADSNEGSFQKWVEDPRGLASIRRFNRDKVAKLKQEEEKFQKELRERRNEQQERLRAKKLREEEEQLAAIQTKQQTNSSAIDAVTAKTETATKPTSDLQNDGGSTTINISNITAVRRFTNTTSLFNTSLLQNTRRTNNNFAKPFHKPSSSSRRNANPNQNATISFFTLFTILTLLRACSALSIRLLLHHTSSSSPTNNLQNELDLDDDNNSPLRRRATTPFLRRRRPPAARGRARYQALVDRLNQTRIQNGERPISAESLRLVLSNRDFDPNDYDSLLQFNEENGPAVTALMSRLGATEREIERCPSHVIREGDDLLKKKKKRVEGGGDEEEVWQHCAVCLEVYKVGDLVRTIPCFHAFHAKCIDPWLAMKAECPVCKHPALG